MQIRTATADTRFNHARNGEAGFLRRWKIEESVTRTVFVTTDDGWELAVHHYQADTPTFQHPVVLCHGVACSRLLFDTNPTASMALWLAARGFSVYSVELRGHGLSQKVGPNGNNSCRFNDHVDFDVPALLDVVLHLSGASQVHWVGHSMGGIVMYARTALGDDRIRSGVAVGASLNYSGLPTFFRLVTPLAPWSRPIRALPIDMPQRVSAQLVRISPRLYEHQFVALKNVDTKTYQSFAATGFHVISTSLLRDLALMINGKGIKSSGGKFYEQLLFNRAKTPPTLAVAGTVDRQCPPATCARFGDELEVFGRAYGHDHDYGHLDLIMGSRARSETWPAIANWMANHDPS